MIGSMPCADPARASPPAAAGAVILFDGVCNLCSGAVRFVARRDPAGRFRFASLQSAAAARLLDGRGAQLPDSIVLLQHGRVHTRSSAALRIARGLRFPWPLLAAFLLVPRPVRDWVYDLVARRRYRWFGKSDACMVPDAELRARFLADGEGAVSDAAAVEAARSGSPAAPGSTGSPG